MDANKLTKDIQGWGRTVERTPREEVTKKERIIQNEVSATSSSQDSSSEKDVSVPGSTSNEPPIKKDVPPSSPRKAVGGGDDDQGNEASAAVASHPRKQQKKEELAEDTVLQKRSTGIDIPGSAPRKERREATSWPARPTTMQTNTEPPKEPEPKFTFDLNQPPDPSDC